MDLMASRLLVAWLLVGSLVNSRAASHEAVRVFHIETIT